jgi:hypothetical protein
MTPWIEWHGGPCPVAMNTLIEVMLRYPHPQSPGRTSVPQAWDWRHHGGDYDIVAYRVVPDCPARATQEAA